MKKNMGVADRIIRLMLAAVFIDLFYIKAVTGVAGIVLLVLSMVFILTSVFGICPLYTVFGLKSNRSAAGNKKRSGVL